MKKYIYYFMVIFVALSTMMISCTKEDTPVQLTTDTDLLHFWGEAGESVVNVTTNSSRWSAISETSWVITEVEGSRLKVRVSENKDVNSRTALIKVRAEEGVMKTITVEQAAVSKRLSLSDRTHTLSYLGGNLEIYMSSNSMDNLRAECDADWVKLSVDKNKNRVLFSVEKNELLEDRQAIIRFYSGEQLFEETFTVVQEALPELILPYNKWGVKPLEVRLFEEERGNFVQRIPDGLFFNAWGFKTPSPIYNYIEYYFTDKGNYQARLYASEKHAQRAFDVQDKLKIEKFLFQNGFEKNEDKPDEYINAKRKTKVRLVKNFGGLIPYPYIEFELFSAQNKDYPTLTLDEFLGIYAKYAGKQFYTPVEEEYEKANGGKYDAELSDPTTKFYHVGYPWLYRFYDMSVVNDGRIVAAYAGFDNLNVVYYQDELGNYFLTREFQKLMNDSGFELVSQMSSLNRFKYLHRERKVFLTVYTVATTFTGGRKILMINSGGQ